MSKQMILPDQPHIEKLTKRLWTSREVGQAAVMVGAGFSRNAERRAGATPPFPLWAELAKEMYDALYLPADGRAPVKLGAGEALRLASEYETAFGRSALDELLLRSIPDTSYYPGQLHELLLSLPWSDVYTTNYDTLLERTLPLIHDRKYDVVQTALDIPVMTKPRIVKLHGSFTAHRPFIFTEEDYRTYPARFPPFVNLVQQSIMENVFCLVGFSGDDPNFLYWTGWVRDNLGAATPPIYLCGLLNLSTSQRKLLEKRFVIPIDLSPLLADSDLRDSHERHAAALEWFLKTLKSGEPQTPTDWPRPTPRTRYPQIYDLPEVLPGPPSLPDPGPEDPGTSELPLPADRLRALSETWRRTRACYPGWVVLPQDNRESLFALTKSWVQPVLKSIGSLGPPDDLLLLYELNWRLERTLTPISDDWLGQFTSIVEAYNPYPRLSVEHEAPVRPDVREFEGWQNWETVRESWVELAFALLRKARESQDQGQSDLWSGRLREVVRLRPEWQARWYYERSLLHLFRLDYGQTQETLEAWPPNMDLPFWEARRAAVLAETGQLKEAENIARTALNEIRSSLQPASVDYSVLSKEGWVMMLLSLLKLHRPPGDESDYTSRFMNRWEKLRAYRCDPWDETEMLASVMKGADLSRRSAVVIRKQFDPGMITVWEESSSEPRFFELQPAFAFLRVFEEGGVPVQVGPATLFAKATTRAARWVRSLAPFWSLSTIMRACDREALEEWFDRVHVATMGDEEVSEIYQLFAAPFGQMVQRLADSPRGADRGADPDVLNLELLAELLSRLTLRLKPDQLKELLRCADEVYNLQVAGRRLPDSDFLEVLYQRAFEALPDADLFELLPELMSLPIPGEGRPAAVTPPEATEPFRFIKRQGAAPPEADFDRSSWDAPVARLLRVARESNPTARRHALDRLKAIHELGRLSAEEARGLGEALWSREDARGLPAHTNLSEYDLLTLPEPEPGRAQSRVRRALLDTTDGRFGDRLGLLVETTLMPGALVGAGGDNLLDWTPEEVSTLVRLLSAWWEAHGADLKDKGPSPDDPQEYLMDASLHHLLRLLSWAVLPRLVEAGEEVQGQVARLLSVMEEAGTCVLPALPIMLVMRPEMEAEVADRLRANLNQTRPTLVRFAVYGLKTWLVNAAVKEIVAPSGDLLDELVNKVVTRRQPELDTAMMTIRDCLRRVPDVLSERHELSLCVALEYLLADTSLPAEAEREAIEKITTAVPVANRPEHRSIAARLARTLSDRQAAAGREVHPVLVRWRELSLADPLPEVRRAWL